VIRLTIGAIASRSALNRRTTPERYDGFVLTSCNELFLLWPGTPPVPVPFSRASMFLFTLLKKKTKQQRYFFHFPGNPTFGVFFLQIP